MKIRLTLLIAACLFCVSAAFADKDPNGTRPQEQAQIPNDDPNYLAAKAQRWCGTQEAWEATASRYGLDQNIATAACPSQGVCDNPATRDATAITAKNVRVIVHVIRNDNGTGGVSQATVNATIAEMNADYGGNGTNIQFTLTATRFHNNSALASIAGYGIGDWQGDIATMKSLYNESPSTQCNIYISGQDGSPFGTLLGIATFPWDPNALTAQGGLWMNNIAVGAGAGTATHEMGHCLGLWHTHHGVSEVSSCGTCYEYASGLEGDLRGDFADDTPPTPTNYNCSGPGGSDCQGTAWGPTQPQNYMGYGPDACYTLFTTKQGRRMQCWTADRLSGWIGGGGPVPPVANFVGSPTSGTVPLTVNFTDQSSGSPTSWSWTFGDGGTSTAQNPSHVYNATGTYTVSLTATNAQGSDGETKTGYITVSSVPAQQCDDFADGSISNWLNSSGTWTATSGLMKGNSNTSNARRTSPFGSFNTVTITSQVRMNTGRSERKARIIWSYVDGNNYRFIEGDDVNNRWRIYERTGGSNTVRATFNQTISTAVWYNVEVAVASNGQATLKVNGATLGSYTFAARAGLVGAGFNRSNSDFDNYCVNGSPSSSFVNDERDEANGSAAEIEMPESFVLEQNYPNPFNPKTLISFNLPTASHVTLEVFNILGERVTTLINDTRGAGRHVVEWDSRSSSGAQVSSGVYFYRLSNGSQVETRKMLLLK